jgi:hypothetical protein
VEGNAHSVVTMIHSASIFSLPLPLTNRYYMMTSHWLPQPLITPLPQVIIKSCCLSLAPATSYYRLPLPLINPMTSYQFHDLLLCYFNALSLREFDAHYAVLHSLLLVSLDSQLTSAHFHTGRGHYRGRDARLRAPPEKLPACY